MPTGAWRIHVYSYLHPGKRIATHSSSEVVLKNHQRAVPGTTRPGTSRLGVPKSFMNPQTSTWDGRFRPGDQTRRKEGASYGTKQRQWFSVLCSSFACPLHISKVFVANKKRSRFRENARCLPKTIYARSHEEPTSPSPLLESKAPSG